jgi:hypothetical protein
MSSKTVGNFDSLNIGNIAGVKAKTYTAIIVDADIKALPTTEYIIVPAAGAGKLIYPRFTTLMFKSSAVAYGNIDPYANVYVTLAGGGISLPMGNDPDLNAVDGRGFFDTTTTIANATDFFGSTGGVMYQIKYPFDDHRGMPDWWGLVSYVYGTDANTNLPLKLKMANAGSGNLTGGNAANRLYAVTDYLEITVP